MHPTVVPVLNLALHGQPERYLKGTRKGGLSGFVKPERGVFQVWIWTLSGRFQVPFQVLETPFQVNLTPPDDREPKVTSANQCDA